jgi:hypothetical protein
MFSIPQIQEISDPHRLISYKGHPGNDVLESLLCREPPQSLKRDLILKDLTA